MKPPAPQPHESSAFAHLPAAFAALLPEMASLPWPEESRADCSRCVMTPEVTGEPADSPFVFHPEGRCCTYHPGLANFLIGRALAEGGTAARVARRRIEQGLEQASVQTTGQGIELSPMGIRPAPGWSARYAETAAERFGRDLTLRCPYWVGGDHACGLWRHRPATCRTWHCKHDQGLQGAAVWAQLQRVLAHIEHLLARFCVDQGQPPRPEDRTVDAWTAWYRWCARRIESADDSELRGLADPALTTARRDLVELARRPPRILPEVVVPAVSGTWREPHGVRIAGYSRYDTVVAPPSIFALLSRLDGRRTWRQARAELPGPERDALDPHIICELYRIGALEAPGARDPTVIHRKPWRVPWPGPQGDG